MTREQDNPVVPWYRHLWVWLVMIPPASAVIAGFTTAWLAGGPPPLVVDDYGEIAMATEQRQNRDALAQRLGLVARIDLSGQSDGSVKASVALTAMSEDFSKPERLRLQLIHPTHEERDQLVVLERRDGIYDADLLTPNSRVYVQLEDLDGQWRLVGELPARAVQLELAARDPS